MQSLMPSHLFHGMKGSGQLFEKLEKRQSSQFSLPNAQSAQWLGSSRGRRISNDLGAMLCQKGSSLGGTIPSSSWLNKGHSPSPRAILKT